jgi:hypothetical protein
MLLLATAFIVWCAGVTEMWRLYVPLVPSCRTPVRGENVIGIDGDRHWVIVREVDQFLRRCGPVRIIDARTGRVVDSVLTANDEILEFSGPQPTTRIVARREGRVVVVDLLTGRETEFPLDFVQSELSLVNDGKTLLITPRIFFSLEASDSPAGRLTTAYDIETGKLLWSIPSLQSGHPSYSPEHATRLLQIVASPPESKPAELRGFHERMGRIIDVQTGEPLTQFGMVTGVEWIIESPDHRWMAMLNEPSGWTVYDAISGRAMFTAPGMNPFATSFSPDSTEFRVRHRMSEDRSAACVYTRYRVTDGAVLETQAGPTDSQSIDSADGRYGLRFSSSQLNSYIMEFNKWLSGIPSPRRLPLAPLQQASIQLVNHSSGRTIGVLPVTSFDLQLSNDSITMITSDAILYYTIPPRHDWNWLLTGLLAPLAVVFGSAGLLSVLRRRHSPKQSVALITPENEV